MTLPTERGRLASARYRETHRDYFARYRAEHREELRAKNRAYQAAHKAERRAYAEAHQEQIDAYQEAYRTSHREQKRANNQSYIASGAKRLSDRKQRAKPDYYLKHSARKRVSRAKKQGLLVPAPCDQCGDPRVHAHHHNGYSDPLDVVWLCALHHAQAHRKAAA